MEYAVLGWPEDGPQLRLDHREFSYAGKFVMSNTGKAVARETDRESDDRLADSEIDHRDDDDALVGAIAFNEDRTDSATAWLRYVTVRKDRRGEGVGARLARFASEKLHERGYDRVQIAVNNPFAYQALYKAGFEFTGEQTGLAEVVLARSREDHLRETKADYETESPRERDRDQSRETDRDQSRETERYQSGLDVYRERDDLAPEEQSFLSAKMGEDPPELISAPE